MWGPTARWWRGTPRGDRIRRLGPATFLLGLGVITVGALHYADYGFYVANKGFFMQGRYLLPLAAIVAAIVAFAIAWLPRRAAPWAAGAWLGALVVLQFASLGHVVERFYA